MRKYILFLLLACLGFLPFAETAHSKPKINFLASSQKSSPSFEEVWELILKARRLVAEDKQNRAVATLTQAFTSAQNIEDDQSKNEALLIVIGELANMGAREEAIALTEKISDSPIFTEASVVITKAYLEAGEYEQGLKYARSLESETAQSLTLIEVVKTFSQAGKLAEAKEIALYIPGDNYQKYQAAEAIIHSYSQKKEYAEALAFIDTLSNENNIYSVASNLAKNAARAGYYDVSFAASKKIPNPVNQVQVMEGVADAHLAVGQIQEARTIVEEAEKLSKQTGDPPHSHWLGKWLATGQEHKVREFAAQLTRGANEDAFDRSLLARVYLNQGQYQQAFEFAKLIPDRVLLPLAEYPDPKVELFTEIIGRALEEKDFAFAKEVALTLTEKEDKVRTLQAIAKAYHFNGNSEQALATLDQAFTIAKTIDVINVTPERHLFFQYSNAEILIPLARDYREFGQKQKGLEVLALAAQSIDKFNQQNSSDWQQFLPQKRIWYVAKEYIEWGEKEKAATLLEQAWQEILGLKGEPNRRIGDMITIAELEEKIGNFDQVKTIVSEARKMNQTGSKGPAKFSSELQFANLLIKIGEQEEAMPFGRSEAIALLDEATPQLEQLRDVPFYINSIAAYKNAGVGDRKLKPLIRKTLRQIRQLPSEHNQRLQLNNLVATLVNIDASEMARDIVQQINDPRQKTDMLLTLARKYQTLDNSSRSSETLNQALATAQNIPNRGIPNAVRAITRDRLLSDQVGAFDSSSYGFSAPATGWNSGQVVKITQAIAKPETKAYLFIGFAFNYAKSGNHKASAQTLALALEAAQDVQDKQTWEDKLWETLQASLEAEEYDLAKKIALATGGVDYQITALRRIAQTYKIAGERTKALETLSQAEQLANTLEPGEQKEEVLAAIASQHP